MPRFTEDDARVLYLLAEKGPQFRVNIDARFPHLDLDFILRRLRRWGMVYFDHECHNWCSHHWDDYLVRDPGSAEWKRKFTLFAELNRIGFEFLKKNEHF